MQKGKWQRGESLVLYHRYWTEVQTGVWCSAKQILGWGFVNRDQDIRSTIKTWIMDWDCGQCWKDALYCDQMMMPLSPRQTQVELDSRNSGRTELRVVQWSQPWAWDGMGCRNWELGWSGHCLSFKVKICCLLAKIWTLSQVLQGWHEKFSFSASLFFVSPAYPNQCGVALVKKLCQDFVREENCM